MVPASPWTSHAAVATRHFQSDTSASTSRSKCNFKRISLIAGGIGISASSSFNDMHGLKIPIPHPTTKAPARRIANMLTPPRPNHRTVQGNDSLPRLDGSALQSSDFAGTSGKGIESVAKVELMQKTVKLMKPVSSYAVTNNVGGWFMLRKRYSIKM